MDRSATDPVRGNEKLKVGSAVLGNLCTGLLAAGFGRWFLTGLDGWAIIWIVFGLTAIAVAIQLMSFLEPEAAHG
jgi:heme/copper-type cytochrome/quinol oxidase subunit 4